MRHVEEALEIVRKLTRWDPAGDDWVKIRQATAQQNARHQKLYDRSFVEREKLEGDTRLVERQVWDISSAEVQFQECFLTFVDSSLGKTVVDAQGHKKTLPLFAPGMTEAAFRAVWNSIKEQELLDEWQELVWEVNPHWCPFRDWKPTHAEAPAEPVGAEAEAKNSPA